MNRVDLTLLKEVYRYEPDTGKVFFRVRRGKKKPGDQAGSRKKDGRIEIHFQGVFIRVHRLAWYLHYNKLPKAWIDHINGDVSDNRIENLREATPGENNRNRGMRSDNKTGYKGVNKNRDKFYAHIQIPHGPKKFLGSFSTAREAHLAYRKAAKELYGGFARFQ